MNIEEFKEWKKQAKLRGITEMNAENFKKLPKLPAKVSVEKSWLDWNLRFWATNRGIKFVKEFTFDREGKRKFRFDYCFPEIMIAIEYEGIFSAKSGHLTAAGYSANCEKYNLAAVQGWRVLRYTAKMNYKNVLQDLQKMIENQ